MRCLVTGAYGFIGREVVAALKREGVTAIGAGRDLHVARRVLSDIDWVACHFNKDVEVSAWAPRLEGIDAVVNCVGILQGSMSDRAERIHADATIVLFEACAAVGVKRIVHISAVSAEAGMATAYARSKAKADAALAGLDVNWLVVKPSLVIGRGSYGGTLLMRGLAGLPLVLPLPGKAAERFQPIAADDLAHGIAHLAARDEPARTTLYAAGTETVSIRDILVAYRAWLGFGRAPEVTIPLPLLSLLLRFGDIRGLPRPRHLGAEHFQRDACRVAGNLAGPPSREELLRGPSAPGHACPVLDPDGHPHAHAEKLRWRHRPYLGRRFRRSPCGRRRLGRRHRHRRAVPIAAWVRRAGVAQLVLSTIYLVGLSLVAPALWIVASLALYIVIAACWLPVVVLQIRMRGRRGQGVGLTAALPPPVASLVLARLAGLLVDAGHFLADGRQARLSGHKKSPTCHTGEPGSEKRKLTVKPLGY